METGIDLKKFKLDQMVREYAAIICIIFIIAIPGFYYLNIFRPLLAQVKAGAMQIAQRKADIQRAKIDPELLKKLEQENRQINEELGKFYQKLSLASNVPQILNELNRVAEATNVKFVSLVPQEVEKLPVPQSQEALDLIPIKIKLNCKYHDLGRFINRIESSDRFVKISELKIVADSKSVWQHNIELLLTSYGLVTGGEIQQ